MRFRLLLIVIGGLAAVATWTFPYWQPLLPAGGAAAELFPGLAPELQGDFAALPPERQEAYRALSDEDSVRALAMLTAALTPGASAPANDEELPEMIGSTMVSVGAFGEIDPTRYAEGEVSIYQDASGGWLLRFEDFSVVNGPDLRVVLSASAAPRESEEMRAGDLDYEVGELKGVTGNQNYVIPPEVDIQQYGSVVIYSAELDLIYSSAGLFARGS
ncbi:MAG: DM13 domain-containing protein [Anaerolineae bacterium]|nr:DM13 domain-containing protein [Anaerolineae bacterium]